MKYIISKQNDKYLAWQYVKSIVDNGAIGLMPGEHTEVGFCACQVITIVDDSTRSFAYGLAIAEYLEDDEFLAINIDLAA